MCDYWQRMENSRGDLADIVRSGSRAGQSTPAEFAPALLPWPPLPCSDLVPGAQNPSEYSFIDPLLEFFDAPLAPKNALISEQETMKSPPYNDDLLRVLQISPPPPAKPFSVSPVNGSALVDLNHGGAQILSPLPAGTKRRKSQAKKVVCIPAPIAANSKTSTVEVVPSDLWAWRKYGQKPIKGSPYPRGYYRCSSSKGCSARKQVERSRTDPNMLVITYTSEHNHPWPTQRNALAGSTRYRNASKSSPAHAPCPTLKEERTDAHRLAEEEDEEAAAAHKAAISELVSEEDDEFDQMVHRLYKPMIQPDEFFAGLAELEADPVRLIFSKGSTAAKPEEENASLDSFDMFYWGGSS